MDPMKVLVALLVLGFLYRVSLRIWPYTKCGRCKGTGRNAGSNSCRFGMCGACGGSGRKERLGTRLFLRKH